MDMRKETGNMKRYKTKLTIEFTIDAKSKMDARRQFIMRVMNHINLETNGSIKIDFSEKQFKNWNKQTKELLF